MIDIGWHPFRGFIMPPKRRATALDQSTQESSNPLAQTAAALEVVTAAPPATDAASEPHTAAHESQDQSAAPAALDGHSAVATGGEAAGGGAVASPPNRLGRRTAAQVVGGYAGQDDSREGNDSWLARKLQAREERIAQMQQRAENNAQTLEQLVHVFEKVRNMPLPHGTTMVAGCRGTRVVFDGSVPKVYCADPLNDALYIRPLSIVPSGVWNGEKYVQMVNFPGRKPPPVLEEGFQPTGVRFDDSYGPVYETLKGKVLSHFLVDPIPSVLGIKQSCPPETPLGNVDVVEMILPGAQNQSGYSVDLPSGWAVDLPLDSEPGSPGFVFAAKICTLIPTESQDKSELGEVYFFNFFFPCGLTVDGVHSLLIENLPQLLTSKYCANQAILNSLEVIRAPDGHEQMSTLADIFNANTRKMPRRVAYHVVFSKRNPKPEKLEGSKPESSGLKGHIYISGKKFCFTNTGGLWLGPPVTSVSKKSNDVCRSEKGDISFQGLPTCTLLPFNCRKAFLASRDPKDFAYHHVEAGKRVGDAMPSNHASVRPHIASMKAALKEFWDQTFQLQTEASIIGAAVKIVRRTPALGSAPSIQTLGLPVLTNKRNPDIERLCRHYLTAPSNRISEWVYKIFGSELIHDPRIPDVLKAISNTTNPTGVPAVNWIARLVISHFIYHNISKGTKQPLDILYSACKSADTGMIWKAFVTEYQSYLEEASQYASCLFNFPAINSCDDAPLTLIAVFKDFVGAVITKARMLVPSDDTPISLNVDLVEKLFAQNSVVELGVMLTDPNCDRLLKDALDKLSSDVAATVT